MGRYATIKCEYQQDTELCCSGILAQGIAQAINKDRFEEWCLELTYTEVYLVMSEMTQLMGTPATLDYQEITARETGYRKLSILMLWYSDADIHSTLTFC
jgi:hypothetical protein